MPHWAKTEFQDPHCDPHGDCGSDVAVCLKAVVDQPPDPSRGVWLAGPRLAHKSNRLLEARVISVICPFYNEAAIIEGATRYMLDRLAQLEEPWELILVDDGSRDGSRDLLQPIAKEFPSLQAIGYAHNRGRGFALKTGIESARGDIVVTTEVDCSWGDDIVVRLVAELRGRPELDMVIASPNLPGGSGSAGWATRCCVSGIAGRSPCTPA